jgi:competence protein ComEC
MENRPATCRNGQSTYSCTKPHIPASHDWRSSRTCAGTAPDYVPGVAPHNNDSLVLEVTYGQRSILLTGDAERPIEDDMVAEGELHRVTLLKVGHHGSKTSSSEEFLSQVNPKFALISDGYKNQFHHPNAEVLERLARHHVQVFRTDQRGLITFSTDGNKVELEPFH